MLLSVSYVVLIACLCLIFLQDLKYREVNVLYFIGAFLSSIIIGINLGISYKEVGAILSFLLFIFIVLKGYIFLRKIEVPKDLQYGGLAIGDVVLFVVVIPLFTFTGYLFFFVTGMIFSLIIHFLILWLGRKKNKTVPLAGHLSLYLIILLTLSNIIDKNLLNKGCW